MLVILRVHQHTLPIDLRMAIVQLAGIWQTVPPRDDRTDDDFAVQIDRSDSSRGDFGRRFRDRPAKSQVRRPR